MFATMIASRITRPMLPNIRPRPAVVTEMMTTHRPSSGRFAWRRSSPKRTTTMASPITTVAMPSITFTTARLMNVTSRFAGDARRIGRVPYWRSLATVAITPKMPAFAVSWSALPRAK